MSKTAHELTRKEMKGPDRFQVLVGQAATWIAQRQKLIGTAVGVAVAVILLVAIAWVVNDSRREKAGALLFKAVEAASGEISEVATPDSGKAIFKSSQERDQAVLDAIAKLRAASSSSRAMLTADLLEGNAQLDLRNWDKSIAAYRRYLAGAEGDDGLRFAALDGLAKAQLGQGDLESAAATYDQLGAVAAFKDRASLGRARVLAKSGKKDEARKVLEAVPQASPFSAEAREQVAQLGGQ